MSYTASELVALLQTAIDQLNQIMLGDSTQSVSINGVSKPSISKQIEDKSATIAAMAQGYKGYATLAALNADLAPADGTLGYVTNDATATSNGLYRKTGATGTGSWTKSSYDPQSQVIRLGRLLRNSGATYPLKSMNRAGTTSAENTTWSNLLLDVRVVNARHGEYYRIAYQQNNASLDGENAYDWIIEKADEATYASTGAVTTLIGYQDATYGNQPSIDRNGGVQTIRLTPPSRPEMQFVITLDASKLPAEGSVINSYLNNTYSGWSWIIDPSCYQMKDSTVLRTGDPIPQSSLPTSLMLDQGKAYPNRSMNRNGETSASAAFLLDAVLKVKVVGAKEGKFYGIRYFKNGTTLLPGYDDGWIIEEQDAATYSTSETATRVVTYTDPAPAVTRDGTVQTIRLLAPRDPGLEFLITLDTSKLPTYGTFVRLLNPGEAGYSWVIDPSCYTYHAGSTSTGEGGSLTYNISSGGALNAIWQSGEHLYRLRFGPNGFNTLPNIIGIDYAPLGDPNTATWTQINTAGTDWLPPMVVEAVANGDGGPQIYTGGNHGSDGGAGGSNTARNALYKLLVDGQPLGAGTFAGSCGKITALIVNELMAYNTITLGRYVLRQSFMVDIRPGSVEVKTEVRAYEAIKVKTDNGPQMVTTGFQGTQLFVGGQTENRVAFDSTAVSGQFTSYPDCWALVLQSAVGQQVSWMDREYEAGDGRYIGGTASAIRGGGATNTKFYHAAVASYTLEMAANATYKWRGGYAWQGPNMAPAGFDSIITFHKGGEQCEAYVVSASNYTVLP